MPEGFDPVYIGIGLVLCLFGWVLYWTGLRLLGAALGAVAAAALAWSLLQQFEVAVQWTAPVVIVAGIVGGVLGVLLITNAHYFLFFITGAMLGLLVATAVESSYPEWFNENVNTPLLVLAFYGAAALVAGILVVVFNRVIVIAATSIAGSVMVVMGLPPQYSAWVFLPLLLGSFLLQLGALRMLGRPGGRKEAAGDEGED